MSGLLLNNLNTYTGTKECKLVRIVGDDAKIPVTIINGSKKGSNVLITSGIHGCEYVGVKAAIDLANEIDASMVSGNIIIVHPVNVEGFKSKIPAIVPQDGKNINRVFPGNEDGSISERIAYTLTYKFQSIADFYIDLHGGDLYENLTPYAYYPGIGDEEVINKSKKMAEILDVGYVVKSKATTGAYNSAAIRGVPSILIERGGMGLCNKSDVDLYKKDILNILKSLNILYGNYELRKSKAKEIENVEYLISSHQGCWIPSVKEGEEIKKGQELGQISDYFGKVLHTYYAKFDGVVLYYTVSLSIDKGESIIAYGEIK